MVHPIIDEYYNHNPYHLRSSQYVQDKGLVTSEKGVNGVATPGAGTPGPTSIAPTAGLTNGKKSGLSATLHDSLAGTLLPTMHNRSASPALSPANENIPRYAFVSSDLRHLTSVQNLHPQEPKEPRPVEQGCNTKKKRASISAEEQLNPLPQVVTPTVTPPQSAEPDSPRARAFGDRNKIAQYFPELN